MADTQVETIMLSAPSSASSQAQQAADLIQILTTSSSSSSVASMAAAAAAAAAPSTSHHPSVVVVSTSLSAAPSTSSSSIAAVATSSSSSSSSASSSSPSTAVQQQQQSNNNSSTNTTAVDTTNQALQQLLCSSKPLANSNEPSVLDGDEEEPEAKRRKTRQHPGQVHEKLESRLNGILCCAVCLDLPKMAIYQCQMGHLMCAACFTHLLADGRLRDQAATCPNCRVEISKSSATRNLAVEKAVSELPNECQYCNKEFPSKSLDRHEVQECEERPTSCKYACIGCPWNGPVHEADEHQLICSHPRKSGAEVMAAIQAQHNQFVEEKKNYAQLIDLLSYEKIIFSDLQMKPYRTDEYVQKLFYETARFSAFNHQFAVKARINNSQRDPHHSNERQLSYQLILKTKTSTPLPIHFFVLKGPFSDSKMETKIYKHDFTDTENASEYQIFPLPDSSECNKLLAAKAINFRLIMFLLSK